MLLLLIKKKTSRYDRNRIESVRGSSVVLLLLIKKKTSRYDVFEDS